MSTVNYSEVLKKTIEHGGAGEAAAAFVRGLSITLIPFDETLAAVSADLYPQTTNNTGFPLPTASASRSAFIAVPPSSQRTANGSW
jgi:hypothetical protein